MRWGLIAVMCVVAAGVCGYVKGRSDEIRCQQPVTEQMAGTVAVMFSQLDKAKEYAERWQGIAGQWRDQYADATNGYAECATKYEACADNYKDCAAVAKKAVEAATYWHARWQAAQPKATDKSAAMEMETLGVIR
jgi:hypothetical protein